MKQILNRSLVMLLIVIMAASMAFSLVGCGNSTDSTQPDGSDAAQATKDEPTQAQDRPKYTYTLNSIHQVAGRQGICVEGDYYWVIRASA